MNNSYKWFHYIVIILLALLSILKAMSICIEQHWGYIPCGLIAVAIFGCVYGFFRLCFLVARRIMYAYADVYKYKVIPRLEMQAIEAYIAEHPLLELQDEKEQEMNDANVMKNHQMSLEQFMVTCKAEREVMMKQKEKNDAIKLGKIQAYTRQTFMKFDFTDEELYQLNECVTAFVTLGASLSNVGVHIVKKPILKQKDIQNFSWNIAHQYNIAPNNTGRFILNTFPAWFSNTELTTVVKNLKNTQGLYNIEIDEKILEHLDNEEVDKHQ